MHDALARQAAGMRLKLTTLGVPVPDRFMRDFTNLRPRFVKREDWDDLEVPALRRHAPTRFTLHHSDSNDDLLTLDTNAVPETGEEVWRRFRAQIAQIQDFDDHLRAIRMMHRLKGWNDIGYHFIIAANGVAYEGVDVRGRGTHVYAQNDGNLGISLDGSFMRNGPTADQVVKLTHLLVSLSVRYGIDVSGEGFLLGHRDQRATDCPGDVLYELLPDIRRAVRAAVRARTGLTARR